MEYETFSDYLDALHEAYEESFKESAKDCESIEDFKMKVFFDMKTFIVNLPKIASEIALKELRKI